MARDMIIGDFSCVIPASAPRNCVAASRSGDQVLLRVEQAHANASLFLDRDQALALAWQLQRIASPIDAGDAAEGGPHGA